DEAIVLAEFARDVFGELAQETRRYSNFADLKEVEPFQVGKTLHLRFAYETGDAAGQNMTTICTANACSWLMREFEARKGIAIRDWMLEGNLGCDKKASRLSASRGRGVQVIAECQLPRAVLQRVLKTTPEQMVTAWTRCKSAAMFS